LRRSRTGVRRRGCPRSDAGERATASGMLRGSATNDAHSWNSSQSSDQDERLVDQSSVTRPCEIPFEDGGSGARLKRTKVESASTCGCAHDVGCGADRAHALEPWRRRFFMGAIESDRGPRGVGTDDQDDVGLLDRIEKSW